jgi:DNA-binding helix-hairpin-helix protein with protein kinase domain
MFWLGSCHECELRSEALPQSVGSSVTIHAQRDQVRFVVVAAPAPEVQMMYLQALHRPTGLTSPAIALKHLAM